MSSQGQPHREALADFPKQNNKCPCNKCLGEGGGWAFLEFTEPLSRKVAFD